MSKVLSLDDAISRARESVTNKLKNGEKADESVEIGDGDRFKIYAAAGKTIDDPR